jgi:hypothetical protein
VTRGRSGTAAPTQWFTLERDARRKIRRSHVRAPARSNSRRTAGIRARWYRRSRACGMGAGRRLETPFAIGAWHFAPQLGGCGRALRTRATSVAITSHTSRRTRVVAHESSHTSRNGIGAARATRLARTAEQQFLHVSCRAPHATGDVVRRCRRLRVAARTSQHARHSTHVTARTSQHARRNGRVGARMPRRESPCTIREAHVEGLDPPCHQWWGPSHRPLVAPLGARHAYRRAPVAC